MSDSLQAMVEKVNENFCDSITPLKFAFHVDFWGMLELTSMIIVNMCLSIGMLVGVSLELIGRYCWQDKSFEAAQILGFPGL